MTSILYSSFLKVLLNHFWSIRTLFVCAVCIPFQLGWSQNGSGSIAPIVKIQFEPVHQWRPPFGLDRVGFSTEAVIEIQHSGGPSSDYQMIVKQQGKTVANKILKSGKNSPAVIREVIASTADEVLIATKGRDGKWRNIKTASPDHPGEMECEAAARPVNFFHPIDLGTILAPADWLLIRGGNEAFVDFALVTKNNTETIFKLKSWYQSDSLNPVVTTLNPTQGKKLQTSILLPASSSTLNQDQLTVLLTNNEGKEIWRKNIPVMLVQQQYKWPGFGAVKTKLRYDLPIVNIVDGKNKPFNYNGAWKEEKEDYVVFLPNGSRWVFWRGASYIPVWVSKYNTGLSYEWAERISPLDGFTDCPEPLMDKELRYGKVDIIESTPARVHVRWSYQSCDFNYKVNGDFAQEDYYFYPDGKGTRVLTLTSLPAAEYEVAEFILLAPQAALPFDIMPSQPMDIISFNTGKKSLLTLPETDTNWKNLQDPLIYRMKIHKNEPQSAFSFNPLLQKKPFAFGPFKDKGLIVTPAYWGGHWPLSQGFNTGRSINESIWSAPSHNSLITWGAKRPEPIRTKTFETFDALGVKKMMREETWVWLIGMTDESDQQLLETAKSFAAPAVLTVVGGRQEPDGYSSERRAFKLIAEKENIQINITPKEWCINPVFEIKLTDGELQNVTINGKKLQRGDYEWDGNTLWVKARLNAKTLLQLKFIKRQEAIGNRNSQYSDSPFNSKPPLISAADKKSLVFS